MKRALTYTVVTLLVLVVLAAVGGRLALGSLVASEEFRSRFNDALERALRTVLPTAMTELKATRLTGLATLELEDLTVTSSKDVRAALPLPKAQLTPRFRSLFAPGPVVFDGDAQVGDTGHLTFSAAVPRSVIRGDADAATAGTESSPSVTVDGAFDHLSAATLAGLVLSEKAGPSFELTSGEATGTFGVAKPLGRHDGRHKSGQALVHLGETQWKTKTATEKTITLPPLDVDLALEDFVLRLKSPVTLTERTGRTTVAGSLLLPERADRPARWELEVAVEGDTGLAGSLAKLLRCTAPAPGPRFHVDGPLGAPACPPT